MVSQLLKFMTWPNNSSEIYGYTTNGSWQTVELNNKAGNKLRLQKLRAKINNDCLNMIDFIDLDSNSMGRIDVWEEGAL